MRLNLPILDQIADCEQVLIAGMGGGFDVFCGLPIYFELQQCGYDVHLASLTDSSLKRMRGARRLTPSLIGVMATTDSNAPYFPELHLSQWFKAQRNEEVTIWCFEKLGVRPVRENYETLCNALSVDAIILIDGGVDSLIRGDEYETGSVLEDVLSLAAVDALENVPVRLSCCLGFGAELEITHAHVLENIAALAMDGAFLGSCSLTQAMNAYPPYEQALLHVQSQPRQDASVINSSVVSAVQGHYGDYHLTDKTRDSGRELWISPFMAMYWFFDLPSVARQNLFVDAVRDTETLDDVWQQIKQVRAALNKRPDFRIPLL